jgi:1-deoxy-D-xylulose-5-phosphate synthase
MFVLDKINNPDDIKKLDKSLFNELAQDLRTEIINVVSKNGGHLASSLGVVELTIALLYSYNFPEDKLVWDVGHQSYAYKILTERKDLFSTLRQWKGLSGFPKITESKYDAFGTGHASTSISSALGIAVARDLKKENNKVIAVIGDGSMTGGLAFEGLNNAGHLHKDMLVILNDNEMFISDRVGALGQYFTKILSGGLFSKVEKQLEILARRLKNTGDSLLKVAKRVKTLFFPGMVFEEMGFCYLGPVDGHDINGLIEIFENIKKLKGPVLLHIVTKKGKGYEHAENEPEKFHGLGKFDKETGKTQKMKLTACSYTEVFGESIVKLAKKDSSIIAVTAAMAQGTGLEKFQKEIPDRFFDVGIAESHAVTFASGLAVNGMKPICALYSTFMQRAYDNIIHDVCLQNLPVVLALDRAGIVGEDGATHNGVFDISYLRLIPNLTIMCPSDDIELSSMLKFGLYSCNGPVALRYPRGEAVKSHRENNNLDIKLGKAEIIFDKGKTTVIAVGSMVYPARLAIERLIKEKIYLKLINARFVKPFDEKTIRKIAEDSKQIITIEENVLAGGFGSLVREVLSDMNIPIHSIGIPDEFVQHGAQDIVRNFYGLTEEKLYKQFKGLSGA